MTLLTLPRELVERILLALDSDSVRTCRLVNRELDDIVKTSTLLQYLQACEAAGVIDNHRSPLSYAERLEALRMREDAWRKLKPVFETTVKVAHQTSTVYDLTAGAYLLGDMNLKDLHYCRLTSSPEDKPRWTMIPGHGPEKNWPGVLVDMGMAVYEHDLIVNVISSDVGVNQGDTQRHSLDLILLKFSTGEYHPLARHPRIHVQRSPSPRPAIALEIVGDNLVLVVNSQHGTFPDKLFIFDWKTGHKRLQHQAIENAYTSLLFVSPELLLVPNLVLSHFEVWHLPPTNHTPKPPRQILSLQFPAISRSYFLLTLSCRGEPSPFLHSIPHFPPRPFYPSPEDSIIIANLRFASFPGLRGASYTLVMHRRALLDTIQKWMAPSLLEQQEDLPTWLTNEVTVQKVVDPDDRSIKLDAQSKLVSMMPHPRSPVRTPASPTFAIFFNASPTSPISPISPTLSPILSESDSSSISSGSSTTSPSTSRYDLLQVQWPDWGPPISRWFQANDTQTRWITTSAGQRCAFLFPNPNDRRKSGITIADFNPHNVKQNERKMKRETEDNDNDNIDKEEEEEEEWELLNNENVFSEEVYMGLKCVIYPAPGEYDFDGLLMDEERLLGLKVSHGGRIESVRVLYFG